MNMGKKSNYSTKDLAICQRVIEQHNLSNSMRHRLQSFKYLFGTPHPERINITDIYVIDKKDDDCSVGALKRFSDNQNFPGTCDDNCVRTPSLYRH